MESAVNINCMLNSIYSLKENFNHVDERIKLLCEAGSYLSSAGRYDYAKEFYKEAYKLNVTNDDI